MSGEGSGVMSMRGPTPGEETVDEIAEAGENVPALWAESADRWLGVRTGKFEKEDFWCMGDCESVGRYPILWLGAGCEAGPWRSVWTRSSALRGLARVGVWVMVMAGCA